MGLKELARSLNNVNVKYKGSKIKHIKSTARTLKIKFDNLADKIDALDKARYHLCDYVVYSLRETGLNISRAKKNTEIVQGASNPVLGPRKTIY